MATVKTGYRVIFEGRGKITWEKILNNGSGINPSSLNQNLAIANTAIQAIEAIARLGQWHEMHRQNNLNIAQFEERRISWLVEMISHIQTEFQQGQINLDSFIYLKREVKSFFDKIKEIELMDVPSVVLLSIERLLNTIKDINIFLNEIYLKRSSNVNFVIVGKSTGDAVINYKPYNKLLKDGGSEEYLKELQSHIEDLSLFTTFTSHGLAGLAIYKLISQNGKKKENAIREEEFQIMKSLIIEIESSVTLQKVLSSTKNPLTLEIFPLLSQ